jgi:hypothetical protein
VLGLRWWMEMYVPRSGLEVFTFARTVTTSPMVNPAAAVRGEGVRDLSYRHHSHVVHVDDVPCGCRVEVLDADDLGGPGRGEGEAALGPRVRGECRS